MTASAQPGAAAGTYQATLVRGSTYALLRSRKFLERGKPVTVTEAEKAYLEKHAVDDVSLPPDFLDRDGPIPNQTFQKFEFTSPAGEAA